MKVLVTGGAGFIGTNLCSSLLKNHDIYSIDNYSIGSKLNHVEGVSYIDGDVVDIFDHFDKNCVIAVTGDTVVFSPRAAGEAPDMDMLLNYMILKLDQVVEKSYNLVYCHTGMNWFSRKHFAWLKEAYSILGRKFKKNINMLSNKLQ